MSARHLIRIGGLIAASLATVAFAGLPWADASSKPRFVSGRVHGKYCTQYDADDAVACLPYGPRGKTGRQGARGARGPIGLVGVVGVIGPVGALGPQGLQGPQGPVGPTGPTGPSGAFVQASPGIPAGSDSGGNTIVVVGKMIGPIFPNGQVTGTEINPPAVARCPTSGPDQSAYDGGALVSTSNPANPGQLTGDVVGLESSYPGLFVSQSQVDPLPLGSAPGGVSNVSANAYEAQAVITEMNPGDSVSVQAYVVCGP